MHRSIHEAQVKVTYNGEGMGNLMTARQSIRLKYFQYGISHAYAAAIRVVNLLISCTTYTSEMGHPCACTQYGIVAEFRQGRFQIYIMLRWQAGLKKRHYFPDTAYEYKKARVGSSTQETPWQRWSGRRRGETSERLTVAMHSPRMAIIGTMDSNTSVMLQPLEKATAIPARKVPTLWIRFPTFSPMACWTRYCSQDKLVSSNQACAYSAVHLYFSQK